MNTELEAAGIAPHLSVGEVAKRSGVSVSTLHFYEKKGLIESARNAGNQRRYARDVLRRVSFIRVAQRVGIPLKHIGDALARLPRNTAPTHADWKKLSTDWREDLDLRILQLQKLRNTLDDCIGCGCLSIERRRLRNPLDQLASEGPGAHHLWVDRSDTH